MNEKIFYDKIDAIAEFIRTSTSFAKLAEQRDYFLKRVTNLRYSIDHLDKSLMIAILGGTGVGKSTLINALAKGDISPASIIRPVTRNNVFYYHVETNTAAIDHIIQADDKAFIHEIAALKDKILIDTPDIDSVITANQERMLKALEGSDLVLCMVTAEKYKNQSLFDILKELVDIRHFIFLFNKIDLGVSTAAVEDFENQLKIINIQNPLILKISSENYADAEFSFEHFTVQNEFRRLEDIILEKITAKKIREIKNINLENNINHFMNELKAVVPDDAEKTLARFKALFEENYQQFAHKINQFYSQIILDINTNFLYHYLYSCYILSFKSILGVYFLLIDKFKSIFYPRYLSAATHSPDEVFKQLETGINKVKQDALLESYDRFSTEIQTSFFQFVGDRMVEFENRPNNEFLKFNAIIYRQIQAGLSPILDKYYYRYLSTTQKILIFVRNVLLNLPLMGLIGFCLWKMFSQYFEGNIPSSDLFFFHFIVLILGLVVIHFIITRIWFRFKMHRLFKRLRLNFQNILSNLVRDRFYEPLEKVVMRIHDDVDFLKKL